MPYAGVPDESGALATDGLSSPRKRHLPPDLHTCHVCKRSFPSTRGLHVCQAVVERPSKRMWTDTDTGLPEYVPTNFETFESIENDSNIVMDGDPDKSARKVIKLKKRKQRTVAENVASSSGPEEVEVRTVVVSLSANTQMILCTDL